MNYATYDIASGEVVTVQANNVLAEGQGSIYLDTFPADYIFFHYVVGGELVLRPVSLITLSGGIISFFNTHPQAVATISNTEGGTLDFSPQDLTLTSPGQYHVKLVQPFPYPTISEDINNA
tara:strand:- start:3674 stop:4036 length:363 start_codon:yes stop_codon:yes gene_type:complete